jgi:hypothetical protein
MAKPIDHMEAAGTIALMRVLAWACALAGGIGAAALLVYGMEMEEPPFLEAGAVAFAGALSWTMLSVFAYVAQCVGRIAMRADQAQLTQEGGEPGDD